MIIYTIFLLIFSACSSPASHASDQVCFKNDCFKVSIAKTQEELRKGLQGTIFLEPQEGMLFLLPAMRRQSFWMKDTLIPLDMIWLDYKYDVVDIAENVSPCLKDPCPVYAPRQEALYVLEINGASVRHLGIKIGDRAVFKLRPNG